MMVYGQAMSSSKREANGKAVEMVLKPTKASAKNSRVFPIGSLSAALDFYKLLI
jgi:hypothetical protein